MAVLRRTHVDCDNIEKVVLKGAILKETINFGFSQNMLCVYNKSIGTSDVLMMLPICSIASEMRSFRPINNCHMLPDDILSVLFVKETVPTNVTAVEST